MEPGDVDATTTIGLRERGGGAPAPRRVLVTGGSEPCRNAAPVTDCHHAVCVRLAVGPGPCPETSTAPQCRDSASEPQPSDGRR